MAWIRLSDLAETAAAMRASNPRCRSSEGRNRGPRWRPRSTAAEGRSRRAAATSRPSSVWCGTGWLATTLPPWRESSRLKSNQEAGCLDPDIVDGHPVLTVDHVKGQDVDVPLAECSCDPSQHAGEIGQRDTQAEDHRRSDLGSVSFGWLDHADPGSI